MNNLAATLFGWDNHKQTEDMLETIIAQNKVLEAQNNVVIANTKKLLKEMEKRDGN